MNIARFRARCGAIARVCDDDSCVCVIRAHAAARGGRGCCVYCFANADENVTFLRAGHALGDRTITVREDKAPTKAAGGGKKTNSTVLSDAPAGGDGCRCYFGNLAWETTEETLINHCTGFGMTVVQAEVARQSGGRSKGWALVDFATAEEAQNAIVQMHNSDVQGRSIIVRVERPGAGAKGARVETRPENSSGLQIVVRNLPWTTTSEDLRQVFQQVGNVVNAVAVCHTDTGRSKGWGTVLFETREQAQAAIQGFNGVELEHRPMQIKLDRFD